MIRHGMSGRDAVDLGEINGYRNAQASVLAPTGTIGFMMDCDTTGIEPDLALVKYKKLVGGGTIKIVNNTVPPALTKLGYDDPSVKAIVEYINDRGTIEGAPGLQDEHLPVFDCAFKADQRRAFHPLHGTPEDDGRGSAVHFGRDLEDGEPAVGSDGRGNREGVHRRMEAGTEGRRDLSRRLEAHAAAEHERDGQEVTARLEEASRPVRRHLPVERHSITHKFGVAGHEGYLTIGMYEDGTPGEIFIVMAKEGSTLSGVMDSFRDDLLDGAAVRRAVEGPGRQVQSYAIRALGLHVESAGAVREVDHGLHLPVSRFEVPSSGRGACAGRSGGRAAIDAAEGSHTAGADCGRKIRSARTTGSAGPSRKEGRSRRYRRPRRSGLLRVRIADGPQWRLLQVPELRLYERLLLGLFQSDDASPLLDRRGGAKRRGGCSRNCSGTTTPSARFRSLTRHFLDRAATPPGQEGRWLATC